MPTTPPPEPTTFEIPHAESFGGRLLGQLQMPDGDGPVPAVLLCHGFKGFSNWGFFPPLADLLVDRGFAVARFNYSGSGMALDDELVSNTDAFRRNTFSLELRETLLMLDSLPNLISERFADGRIDGDRLALLGHSRGGGAAILASAHPAWCDRLKALVTWSAVATFDRYGRDAREAWRRDGQLPMKNARTGQSLALGVELLHDVEENGPLLDLERAAAERTAPWLIVHGTDDETVPLEEARTLDARATGEHEILQVPGGSHTFGARHPFAGPTPALIQAFNATQTWLRRYLA